MKRLILASSSPRRNDLLKTTGLPFVVARPDIDETPHPGEPADQYVMRLSREKAEAAAQSMAQTGISDSDSLILSADTTVVDVDSDQILGKPDDPDHAAAMLRQLRNRVHVVHTGVTVLDTRTGHSQTRVITTRVVMRAYTDEEIATYIASGDPLGKAGSYAIQNAVFRPVARLEGCYTNVVGLPICAVYALLADHGLPSPNPVPCSPAHLPCVFDGTIRQDGVIE